VAPAEARIDRRLLFGVVDRRRALDHPAEGHLQAFEGGREGSVGARRAADPMCRALLFRATAAGMAPRREIGQHLHAKMGG
jgi:hypothetical protein